MTECVIFWTETAHGTSEEISYCCMTLRAAVEEGLHGHIMKGRIGPIPHHQIGYVYDGEVLSKCPFCDSPIRAEEVKRR